MVTVEETYMPLTLFAPDLTNKGFEELCEQYSDFRLESGCAGSQFVRNL